MLLFFYSAHSIYVVIFVFCALSKGLLNLFFTVTKHVACSFNSNTTKIPPKLCLFTFEFIQTYLPPSLPSLRFTLTFTRFINFDLNFSLSFSAAFYQQFTCVHHKRFFRWKTFFISFANYFCIIGKWFYFGFSFCSSFFFVLFLMRALNFLSTEQKLLCLKGGGRGNHKKSRLNKIVWRFIVFESADKKKGSICSGIDFKWLVIFWHFWNIFEKMLSRMRLCPRHHSILVAWFSREREEKAKNDVKSFPGET